MAEAPGTGFGEADADKSGPSFWERLWRWSGLPGEPAPPAAGGEMAPPGDTHERTLIRNVLRLRDLSAADVMVPRVDIVAVDVEIPFADLVRLLVEEGHSRLPVYRNSLDEIIGMVHVKDVLGFVASGRVAALPKLVRNVLYVAPSTRVLDLLSQMRLQRVHMALVVDEFGGIDGLITIEDLVEEIVGEIEDEHDEAAPGHLIERSDGSLLADARTPIGELEAMLDLKLLAAAEEEVDTVGGLIFMLAGRVPRQGEIIQHPSGLQFEVVDADERRVRRLRIRRQPTEAGAVARV